MKIFFYIHSLSGGGAERVTIALARYFAGQGHSVGVITMTSEEQDFYPLEPQIRRVTLNLAGANIGLCKLTANYRRLRVLRQIMKVERPDVVVAMMTTSIVLAILATIGLPIRIYGSERNYPGRNTTGRPWTLLRRLVYRFASGHIAQTREAADWLESHTGALNVNVIPNSVVWPIPSFPPNVIPDRVVLPERKVILAVGSKPEQKGFDLLVRAFGALAVDWLSWDLVIIGLEPYTDAICNNGESIQRLAEELGVAHRLHLPGRVGNVGDWYLRADLFVLSSRYEGFPNVLLEAMASGCPCIAFDCNTGPREIIDNEVNGLLVPSESIEELFTAMTRLVADEKLREGLGVKAVSVREKFEEQQVMALWKRIFEVSQHGAA